MPEVTTYEALALQLFNDVATDEPTGAARTTARSPVHLRPEREVWQRRVARQQYCSRGRPPTQTPPRSSRQKAATERLLMATGRIYYYGESAASIR